MQSDPATGDRLLVTEAEAARLLSLSVRSLYSLRKGGELAFVPVGSTIRYALADLQEFIARRREQGGPR